jgi:hypothetical protein
MDDTSKKSEPSVRRVVWGRQFLASTVVVPPDVAERLNTDAMAVLAVIRNEAQASGKCSLPVARIAERANMRSIKFSAAGAELRWSAIWAGLAISPIPK